MASRHLAFAALVVDAVVLLLLGGSLPAFALAFRVPQDVAGLIFTANGLGFLVAVPACGVLGDRFGKRAVVGVSALGLAVGLLALAASRDLAAGLCAAALIGAASGSVESGITAVLPELYPGREGFANNYAQAFFGVGATAGPLLLLVPGLGWRERLVLCGSAFVVLGAAFWLERRRDRRVPGSDWRSGIAESLAVPGIGASLLAMVLYTGVEVAVWGWLFAVVTRPGGAGPVWAVAELSGFWAAMGGGRFLAGALADRIELPALIAAGTALGVPALVLALLLPSRVGALAAVVVCGLAFSGLWPSLVANGQRRHGQSAFVSALLVGAGGGGSLVVPAAFGFATARLGLPAATAGLALLLAPVALLPRLARAARGSPASAAS